MFPTARMLPTLRHWMAMFGRIATGYMKFELAFDIAEHTAAGTEAKEMRRQPRIAKLFLDQRQPFQRLLGGTNPAGGFEADRHASFFGVFANGAGHHQSNRQGGIHCFLAGRSFNKIRACHHRHHAGFGYVAQS